MLLKLFKIIISQGIRNIAIKGRIFLYRRSGLQAFFTKFYDYEANLKEQFGDIVLEWDKVLFLRSAHISMTALYLNALPDNIKRNIEGKSTELLHKEYTLFFYHKSYQEKVDFNLDPLEGVKWPKK